ncbi:MAG: hypothetical protein ABIP03_03075 [Aquihabitans sp.]
MNDIGGGEDLGMADARDWRNPTVDTAVLLVLVIIAVRAGLSPLHDNSFLTHLSTGRIVLDAGAVPHYDPYSWSAFGHAWTVQSWGASVIYAGAEQIGGMLGIRLINTVCAVALVLILWRLAKPAELLLGRLFTGLIPVAMGAVLWVERPLLFGAVFLGLALLAVENKMDPRWLVPIMWAWVNVHGSFPFGLAVVVLFGSGRWIDERKVPSVEMRSLVWAGLGTMLGAIGPVGPKLLLFPLELLGNREAFAGVVEWQPIRWNSAVHWLFAIQLLVTLVALTTRGRRVRLMLPALAFGAAAVLSSRNVLPASIVLTPILAHALCGLGRLDGRKRPALAGPVTMALGLVVAFSVVVGVMGPNTDLEAYPEQAAAYMRSEGLLTTQTRVVSRDFVGNYLTYAYGPDEVRVFIDDRVDMYPLATIRQYARLLADNGDYQAVLTETRATSVLWDRDSSFGRWLEQSDGWQVVYTDRNWVVAVPIGVGT